MKPYLLEACVDSVESAILAQRGGADRIELCSNMIIGGTTPGIALYEEVRQNTIIKIHVLIRPRYGDFLYSDYEYACIEREVDLFCRAGADGVAIGCLNADGGLNIKQMKSLISLVGDMNVTLHRAFDMCLDPVTALEQAIELGVHTILTSGQQDNCLKGLLQIKELCAIAGDKIDLMAGAGVNADIISQLMDEIPLIRSFHMSGKKVLNSGMKFRTEKVHMGLPGLSEYEIWRTDEVAIKMARERLDGRKEK
jgi:copper homeostasis protein